MTALHAVRMATESDMYCIVTFIIIRGITHCLGTKLSEEPPARGGLVAGWLVVGGGGQMGRETGLEFVLVNLRFVRGMFGARVIFLFT